LAVLNSQASKQYTQYNNYPMDAEEPEPLVPGVLRTVASMFLVRSSDALFHHF